MTYQTTQPFFGSAFERLPLAGDPDRATVGLELWQEHADKIDQPDVQRAAAAFADDPAGRRLLTAILGNSPFLSRCLLIDIPFFLDLVSRGPDVVVSQVADGLKGELGDTVHRPHVVRELRNARRRIALAVALADITDHWSLDPVTKTLSDFAETALSTALSHLLHQAAERGWLTLGDEADPERDCGYCVLAMGKLGAGELNYSSDIDLVVIYDPERIAYGGDRSLGEAMTRLTRDLVMIMEERTADGHVFRTDLRLRPDPGAMPLAISYPAAMAYYESMGQNWERAAMIKARPVAGDRALGREFLLELRPFVWRKHLDFAAIQDIHSIKRQIHAHRGGAALAVEGHNIKLGRGGIREIEFFAQTQQLIYGGREPRLRCTRTLDALAALAEARRIDRTATDDLSDAYRYLRRVEHRLQMIDDQQTHSLPDDAAGLAKLANFLGHREAATFRAELLGHMRKVEDHYAVLFEEAPPLSESGNLVFTGGDPDPDTMETLTAMGYQDGPGVFNLVRSWHHGRFAATRSTRSRELLTELMPNLLKALADKPNPDAALAKFHEFLAGLPAGVQIFSMLAANPGLLDLLAEVMGSAPALAEHLSRKPDLLEAVLTPGFSDLLPPQPDLAAELDERLGVARDLQDVLELSRRWANDRKFQVGIGILRQSLDVDESGRALSDIAETVLQAIHGPVLDALAEQHGRVPGHGMAVVAMGKLGGQEMTVASDLDLIFIYDAPEDTQQSDGRKPLAPSQYYARLAQRYISALSARMSEGSLYEIDMRLRPSGKSGPIATTLNGFERYQREDAWTWEQMALTRARVVVGDADFTGRITAIIQALLARPRDPDTLLVDVAAMRARIDKEFPAKSLWSLKFLRGGLVDLDFLAQYLQLRHAAEQPDILDRSTERAFAKLARAGLLGESIAQRLAEATHLFRQLQAFLRLTVGEAFDEASAPDGLAASLARAGGADDLAALKERVITTAQVVHEVFVELIDEPAHDAAERLAAAAASED